MRISSLLAASAALCFMAACSPQSPAPGGDQKTTGGAVQQPAPAPARQFASEALVTDTDVRTGKDEVVPVKFFVSGDKMRIEVMDPVEGPGTIIMTPEAAYTIRTERGQTMVMKLPGMDMAKQMITDMPGLGVDVTDPNSGAVQVGPCTAAGTAGLMYRNTKPPAKTGGQPTVSEACVAPVGFPLEAKENGKLVFQTTKFSAGPQDPALFAPPPGAPVQDMAKMMEDTMKKVDPAALEKMKKAMEGAAK